MIFMIVSSNQTNFTFWRPLLAFGNSFHFSFSRFLLPLRPSLLLFCMHYRGAFSPHPESARCEGTLLWRSVSSSQMEYFTPALLAVASMSNVFGSIPLPKTPRCLDSNLRCGPSDLPLPAFTFKMSPEVARCRWVAAYWGQPTVICCCQSQRLFGAFGRRCRDHQRLDPL